MLGRLINTLPVKALEEAPGLDSQAVMLKLALHPGKQAALLRYPVLSRPS
ncbi:MAG: hypothetical protein PHF31_01530 [Methylobacter sp.]|nr:hypothetical protein [Methylobacter sp.]